jgi:hypothetical protein
MLDAVHAQALTILPAIIGAGANLAAVSAGLIALIPILMESARAKNPTYFSYEKTSAQIKAFTFILIFSLIFFGLAPITALIGLTYPNRWLTFVSVMLFVLGTSFVIIAGISVTAMSRR